MARDKSLLLLYVQLAAILTLLIINIGAAPQPPGWLRWGLFAVLLAVSVVLLLGRLRMLRRTNEMVIELKRAIEGNLNTRLLAKDEPWLNELIFAINELIEQLDKLQVRTIRSEAARKRLLSNISHDIRTPLTSIIGYVDALRDEVGVTEEEKREYLDILSRKSGELKQLIDDLFQLAKLDADEIVMKPETLDLAELAREAAIEFLPVLKQHGMELTAVLPEHRCPINADRLSMLRVMNNMIRNAIQYGQEGKQLGIELTETGTEYRLHIWDRGPGIAAEDMPHIFERMYRADRSRTMRYGGSGLGLAIAKALINKQGGTIWVDSAPGLQTTFGISLPKHNAPATRLRNI